MLNITIVFVVIYNYYTFLVCKLFKYSFKWFNTFFIQNVKLYFQKNNYFFLINVSENSWNILFQCIFNSKIKSIFNLKYLMISSKTKLKRKTYLKNKYFQRKYHTAFKFHLDKNIFSCYMIRKRCEELSSLCLSGCFYIKIDMQKTTKQ